MTCRPLLWCLAPFTLAGIAYATAQSLAAHDWLTAGPLLIVLAVGILLIVPGEENPKPSSGVVAPCLTPAQHPHREEAAVGKGGRA